MDERARSTPVAGLVVVAAFLVGYLLPDVVGGQPVQSTPTPASPTGLTQPSPTLAPSTATSLPANPTPTAWPAAAAATPTPTPPSATATSAPLTPTPSTPPTAAASPTPTTAPPASPSPAPPSPTPRVHVVEPGDTLSQLSERYGVTVEAIVAANSLTKPDSLEVGQKLVIPSPAR